MATWINKSSQSLELCIYVKPKQRSILQLYFRNNVPDRNGWYFVTTVFFYLHIGFLSLMICHLWRYNLEMGGVFLLPRAHRCTHLVCCHEIVFNFVTAGMGAHVFVLSTTLLLGVNLWQSALYGRLLLYSQSHHLFRNDGKLFFR